MTKAISIIYKTTEQHRERLFTLLIAAIIFAGFTYVFLLQKAILNVVQRENLNKQIAVSTMQVNDLEEKYFSLKNTVTLELAHSKGLKDAEVSSYISKKPLTAMVSKNEL